MNHNMICEGRLKTGEAAFGAAEQVWWYKRTILRSAQVADIGDHAKRRVLVLISAGAQTQLVLQWRNSGECMQLHQTSQNYQILVISCLVGTQVLVQATQDAQTQLVLQQQWRNPGEAQKQQLHQKGTRHSGEKAPASRRRRCHHSQISRQFAVSMAAAVRWLAAPLGGGRGATLLVGGGGVLGGQSTPPAHPSDNTSSGALAGDLV